MSTFIALLRGVNVGKAKRVPMADWRAQLEALGFTGVATLLNSGNAVFVARGGTAAAYASDIGGALMAQLGVDARVIVKKASELAAIVAENPLTDPAHDTSKLLVAFASDEKALAALRPVEAAVEGPEQFTVGAHAAYLHCPGGILQSRAAVALLGKAGQGVTTRNWATVLKLKALADGSPS